MNEELKIIISAEVDKLKQGVANAKKQIGSFKEQVKKASKDVDKHFQAIGTAAANAFKALAVGAAAGVAALVGISAATAEYRNNQAKLATAFEAAGSSAAVATDTYRSLYRVLGDDGQATEAAQHLAQLTTNEQDLAEWTNICQGVYATFGASLPIESLTEAANETAKTGVLTGSLADALNWCGISEAVFAEQLAACNTEAEREALIRETLNGLYGDAAAIYEENNADILAQNDAQARLTDTLASLGATMTPVITAFMNFANQALDVVRPYIEDLAVKLLPPLKEMLDGIVGALEVGLPWIQEHSTALGIVAGIIGGLLISIGLYNAVAAVKAAMDAAQVTTLWGLVSAYAAQAAAMIVAIAPYVLIVAAIAAVIAIIVLCVKHWDEIKAAVKAAVDAIVKWVQDMAAKVGQWFDTMKAKISNTKLGEFVLGIFSSIYESIKSKIELAKTIVSNVVGAIKGIFTGDFNAVKTSLSNIFSAISNDIKNKFTTAKNTVLGIFDNIKSGLSEKINAAKTAIGNTLETIKGFFNFSFNMPHIPKPSFGITPVGWSVGDLLKGIIPKLSIKWNALGGVFDKPTIFGYGNSLQGIGEDGAEAVVPLEKNTKWLDIIADKLAAKQGNTPIVLTVDGKVFAQTSVDSINALTRQNGKLALNLV